MLPDRLIEVRKLDELTRLPAWLSSRDEVWLRPLIDEFEACAGGTAGGAESRVKRLAEGLAREHGVSMRRVEGVWSVERARWRKHVDSPVEPSRLRGVLFDLAARHGHDEALVRTATVLDVDACSIGRLMFADRERERIMLPPTHASTTSDLITRYNLTLAQSLVARATRVVVTVRSDLRHVISYARLLGLMFSLAEEADGVTKIELSGPLALFHETRKYGHSLARFLPAVASTVGWSAVADVQLRREAFAVPFSPSDPLPRAHALPRSFDSKVEKRLAIDLRKLGAERGWRLERESAVFHTGVGAQLFYPDFTLVSEGGARVLVEVVGFWTPDYLAKKQHALAAVTEPIVICVDERHVTDLGVPRGDHAIVVTYRDRIDSAALLDAAERAARRC